MKEIKILVSFERNEMIFPKIELVANDYNQVEFVFEFDKEEIGTKVFELKKPNGKVFIKEIIDNKVVLSDIDENGKTIPIINQAGIYEFEITRYSSDSKFTINKTCRFVARDEVVNVDDDIIDENAKLPILDDLINTTIELKDSTEKVSEEVKKQGNYAEEQGDYAKEQIGKVIDANKEATKLINNFETNVNKYTTVFNDNAKEKTTIFNTNATDKIDLFNENAVQKTEEFNSTTNAKKITDLSKEFYRVKDEVLETGEATDSYITLNDSSMSEYQELSVDGVSKQETTTGSNKLGFNNASINNAETKGLTLTFSEDNTLTINGTVTDSDLNFFNNLNAVKPLKYAVATNHTFSCKYVSGNIPEGSAVFNIRGGADETDIRTYQLTINLNVDKNNNYTGFTTKVSPEAEGFITGFQIITKVGTTFENLKLKFWLNEGEVADEYENFTGGQPSPSPDYPQPIEVIEKDFNIISCGKNLLPNNIISQIINGVTITKNDDRSISLNGTSTNYFNLKFTNEQITLPKGTYVQSFHRIGSSTPGDGVFIYSKDAYNNQIFDYSTSNPSIRTLEEATTIVNYSISVNKGTVIDNLTLYPMLEQNLATEYEPYQGSSLNITIPENEFAAKINDVKDQFRINFNEDDRKYHLYLDKKIGKIVLDGSESLQLQSINEYGIANFKYTTGKEPYPINFNVISNYFASQNTSISQTKTSGIFMQWQNELYIRVEQEKASTVEEFKQWLSNNNVTVYYVLETPYEMDLGIVDMPITWDEKTHLFTNSDLMPIIKVKYYRNFVSTIRNLQVNNDTLKNELVSIESRLLALENQITKDFVEESEVSNDIQD